MNPGQIQLIFASLQQAKAAILENDVEELRINNALETYLYVIWCHFLCTTLGQPNDSPLRSRIVCLSGISKLC